jgi:hypothetical protein
MRRVYSASDLPQAYLIKELLRQEGIEAQVFNENAAGGLGELPFTHTYPEIWLQNDTDIAAAQEIIRRFETEEAAPGKDRICAECGEANPSNFASCWSCGADLSDPG